MTDALDVDTYIPILMHEQGYVIFAGNKPRKLGLICRFAHNPQKSYVLIAEANKAEATMQANRVKLLGCIDPYLERFIESKYFYKAVTD